MRIRDVDKGLRIRIRDADPGRGMRIGDAGHGARGTGRGVECRARAARRLTGQVAAPEPAAARPSPHPSPAGARRAGAASRETHRPRPGDREALPARPQATFSEAGRGRDQAPRGLTFSDVSLFSASAFGPEWPALGREKTH